MNNKHKDYLEMVLDYLIYACGEKKDYLCNPSDNHIYLSIKPLEDYLKSANRNTERNIMDWM